MARNEKFCTQIIVDKHDCVIYICDSHKYLSDPIPFEVEGKKKYVHA